jgi:DNA-directed RNA polymerase subunit RPC12/RpoP
MLEVTESKPGSLLHCGHCGEEWRQRGEAPPLRCSRCGSSKWRETVRRAEVQCQRCGLRWKPMTEQGPVQCAQCGSTRWREPREGDKG